MKRKIIISLALAMCSSVAFGPEMLAANTADDEKLLRTQAQEFMDAFAKGDAKAIAALWTSEGVLLAEDGQEYRGRANIQAAYEDFFRAEGKQPLQVSIESITFPSADVAIERGRSILAKASTPGAAGRYVAVHVKKDGKWLMDSVTETPYKAGANRDYLEDLDWLIGDWIIDQGTEKRKLTAEWGPNHNFVILTFHSAAGVIEQKELIGWNPLRKQLAAWHFHSDGGWGYSDWYKSGKDWVLNANAVEPDGSTGHAIYNLNRADDNSFTLRSSERWLGNAKLPDTGVIKVVRDKNSAVSPPPARSASEEQR